MTNGQTPSQSLGYKVLYNIDREAAYDLREADTPYKVGEVLCEDLKRWQNLSASEFAEKVDDYANPTGRFFYFAQLHGWFEQISQARACFDLKSEGAARVRIVRLTKDRLAEKAEEFVENGTTKVRYKKTGAVML